MSNTMTETSMVTIITFLAYILGVFALAVLSHRLLSSRSFLSEYFLGSRGLGGWALAFTFAATGASGGSFTGYPSLIYSYGWVLALWIASYMVVPICSMGVLGKRLNQVARRTGAITVPDVLRDRYESIGLGLFAAGTIIFFTVSNLVAQFKAGALIIEETFNFPPDWGYLVSLLIFAGTVVFYTVYGGFRAVVWTDVMQGVVMALGVVVLLPVVLKEVGGLAAANETILTRPPMLVTAMPGPYNDLVLKAVGFPRPTGLVYRHPQRFGSPLTLRWRSTDNENAEMIEIWLATDRSGQLITTANDVRQAIVRHPRLGRLIEVEFPFDNNQRFTDEGGRIVEKGATGVIQFEGSKTIEQFVFVEGHELIFGPGRTAKGEPFHPLGMAISFFFMWAIVGMGQPGSMVRLMAFRDSRSLKRAILTVTVYYALIYLPLVFIFVAARPLVPVLTAENSDKAMVLVTTRVVAQMGLGYQILGAIFVAAPFAAVMSTVDSFLLMISSSLVRDFYQRTINPRVSQLTVKWASYTITGAVGLLVTLLAMQPPNFLQGIIVFTGGGFAASFLWPILLGLYWKEMTRQGAICSMIGGFVIVVGFFAPSLLGGSRIDLLGFHPNLWGLMGSLLLAILVSKLTGPPPHRLVERYFCVPKRT